MSICANAENIAVMAVTLGIEVDNSIRIAQGNDMLKAVVMDSCATEFIEKVCDEVEKKIKLRRKF
ncbi:MAG: hypothetical protein ACLTJN_00360 [Monoglobus pectinilyticus]